MIDWLSPTTASGIGIAALAGLSVGAVFVGGTQLRGGTAVLAAAVMAGLVFQVAHFLEHGLQLGYWMGNRQAPPWITPWAETAADGLGWTCSWVVTGRPSIGVELLHLAGNTIFLAALIGMAVLTVRRGGRVRSSRALVASLGLQGLHVAEHVALTVSVLAAGRAIGLSTGFGELTGATLFTYRIWFHFVVNLVATMLAYLPAPGQGRAAPAPARGQASGGAFPAGLRTRFPAAAKEGREPGGAGTGPFRAIAGPGACAWVR